MRGALENITGLFDIDRRIGMVMGVDTVQGHGSLAANRRIGGLSNRAGKHINSAKEYSGRTL
jgi:hypothetical protein